jgi:hypothetical protein
MRKILRNIARAKMKKAGIRQMNKKQKDGRSYFSKRWRDYAGA